MTNINIDQMQELLRDASATLRKQQKLIAEQEEKLASYRKREEASEIVALMERRRLFPENMQPAEKLAHVLNQGDMNVLRKALELNSGTFDGFSVDSESFVEDREVDSNGVGKASFGYKSELEDFLIS